MEKETIEATDMESIPVRDKQEHEESDQHDSTSNDACSTSFGITATLESEHSDEKLPAQDRNADATNLNRAPNPSAGNPIDTKSNSSRVRAALEESQLLTDAEAECGPRHLLENWLQIMTATDIDQSQINRILVHLAHISIESHRPSILKHVLRVVNYLGSLDIFTKTLTNGLDEFDAPKCDDDVDRQHTMKCTFPSWQHGVDTDSCPVLYMSVLYGRLVECEANDVFKKNITTCISDGDTIFDIFHYIFDEADMPEFYDALLRVYSNNEPEVRKVLRFKSSVVHNAGWMASKQRPVQAQAKLLFKVSHDGGLAAYSLCMLPFDYTLTSSLI